MRGRSLSCVELVELVTDYFDGSLSWSERRRFERHLGACDACSEYLEQMRLVVEATGRLDEESISAPAREALLAGFRDWRRARPA